MSGLNPFANEHVLENIFIYCKPRALLECRLVCSLWCYEATRILRKKAVVCLRTDEALAQYKSTMLNSFLEEPSLFPYTRYIIDYPTAEKLEGLYDFLSAFQSNIQYLKFVYHPWDPSDSNKNNYVKLESIILPELSELQLFSTQYIPVDDHLLRFPPLFDLLNMPKLNHLAVFQLHDTICVETIARMIGGSYAGITELKVPSDKFLQLSNIVKLTSLRNLDLCKLLYGYPASNEVIAQVASSCPALRRISIELGYRVTQEYIQRLFKVLSSTLEYLKVTVQDKGLLLRQPQRNVKLTFPVMHKLKWLSVRFSSTALAYYIDNLPQLSFLELDTPWQKKVRGNLFPGTKVGYSSITNLKLTEILSCNDVTTVHEHFPNLNSLCCSFENNAALYNVYKHFPSLIRLSIEGKSGVTDEAFTGMISETTPEKETASLSESTTLNIGNYLQHLQSLGLCQSGLTFASVMGGIIHIKELRTLHIQSTTLKNDTARLHENSASINALLKLPFLSTLNVWVSHHEQKLRSDEIRCLQRKLPHADVNIWGHPFIESLNVNNI